MARASEHLGEVKTLVSKLIPSSGAPIEISEEEASNSRLLGMQLSKARSLLRAIAQQRQVQAQEQPRDESDGEGDYEDDNLQQESGRTTN